MLRFPKRTIEYWRVFPRLWVVPFGGVAFINSAWRAANRSRLSLKSCAVRPLWTREILDFRPAGVRGLNLVRETCCNDRPLKCCAECPRFLWLDSWVRCIFNSHSRGIPEQTEANCTIRYDVSLVRVSGIECRKPLSYPASSWLSYAMRIPFAPKSTSYSSNICNWW
jgi:hypothetical protein